MNQLIVKNYVAGAAIADNQLVKFGASDDTVVPATASTDAVIGVVDQPNGAASGRRVDVVLFGVTDVQAGGTITRGSPLTSDATGKVVAAAPAAGVNARTIGFALSSMVSGDIMPAFVIPGSLQG
jgi:hypothetical protein